MQSLIKRLADNQDEILKVTIEEGQGEGMRFAGVKSVVAFRNWLKRVCGDENLGLRPENPKSMRSNFWLIRAKIDDSLLQLISALDTIADGERRKIEAERELRLALWKYKEAKLQGAPANEIKIEDLI